MAERQTNTGFKGVYQRASTGKFEVAVRFPKNRTGAQHKHQVGVFDTVAEAVDARAQFIAGLI